MENEIKEFRVAVKSGSGQYYKRIEDIYINGMTFDSMSKKIYELQAENKQLKEALKNLQDRNDQTSQLLLTAIEQLQAKVTRLEGGLNG